jgi:branched-chain amino acid transport system permease protein
MTAAPFLVTRSSRSTHAASIAIAVLIVALASAPLWASTDTMRLLIDIFLYVALASLWNFLAGYAGLVSVGQQAFVGLGGYGLFALTTKAGLPPLICLPIVGLIAGLASIPIARLLFRLRGAYFAISSWVVAEVFRLGAILIAPLGGGSGMSLPARIAQSIGRAPHDRYVAVYLTTLTLLLAILIGIFLVLRSRMGLALTAIRDNELAARGNGVSVDRTKLIVYVATAVGTAMIGALIFLQRLRISPDAAFSVNDWTALVIFMVIIGGLGSFEGPILGTLVYFALRETLANLGPIYLIFLGAIAIAVMLVEPRGLWGYARARWRLQLLPLQLFVSRSDPASKLTTAAVVGHSNSLRIEEK